MVFSLAISLVRAHFQALRAFLSHRRLTRCHSSLIRPKRSVWIVASTGEPVHIPSCSAPRHAAYRRLALHVTAIGPKKNRFRLCGNTPRRACQCSRVQACTVGKARHKPTTRMHTHARIYMHARMPARTLERGLLQKRRCKQQRRRQQERASLGMWARERERACS